MAKGAKGRSLPGDWVARLRVEVAERGERATRERIGIASATFARCLGGLTVYEDTHRIVQAALGAMGAT